MRAAIGSISAAGAATIAGKRPLAASASIRSSSRSSGAPPSSSSSSHSALARRLDRQAIDSLVDGERAATRKPAASIDSRTRAARPSLDEAAIRTGGGPA